MYDECDQVIGIASIKNRVDKAVEYLGQIRIDAEMHDDACIWEMVKDRSQLTDAVFCLDEAEEEIRWAKKRIQKKILELMTADMDR
jgi:hypothetical protein